MGGANSAMGLVGLFELSLGDSYLERRVNFAKGLMTDHCNMHYYKDLFRDRVYVMAAHMASRFIGKLD